MIITFQNDDDNSGDDAGLKVEWYDRTDDQNEELGLNDMKVDGYKEEDGETEGASANTSSS